MTSPLNLTEPLPQEMKLSYLEAGPSGEWKQMESDLASYLKDLPQGRWEREDNKWYLRKDGKNQQHLWNDNCAFLGGVTGSVCSEFLQCVNRAPDSKGFCYHFLNGATPIPEIRSVEEVKKEIGNINPMVATEFLRMIGFTKTYVDEIALSSMRGGHGHGKMVHEDVLESVNDWLNRFKTDDKDLQATFGERYNEIKNALIELPGSEEARKSRENLFRYLQVLVAWVNYNSQVLNEEFSFDTTGGIMDHGCHGKPRTDYTICGPYYTPQHRRAKNICDSIMRMKAGLEAEAPGAVGWNGRSLMDSIMFTPHFQLSLNRAMMSDPYMTRRLYGGHRAVEETIRNMTGGHGEYAEPSGYESYKALFEELKGIMGNMGTSDYKMKLKDRSAKAIEDKLNKLKETEEAVIRALTYATKDKDLYMASQGKIDIRQIYRPDDKALQGQLRHGAYEKNADLLGVTALYNRRAANMLSTLLTIAQAVVDKYETGTSATRVPVPGKSLDKIYIPGVYKST
jgi:hypothetical protein